MSRRLIDNSNIKNIIKRTKEFSFRAHGITMLRITYGLTGILALLILSIQALTGVMHADITKATIDNLAFAVIFIAGALTILTGLFICLIWRLQKIIKISEFQNMLFSGAMRDKHDYCIMLTADKELIYMDDKAQKVFDANSPIKYQNFAIEKIFDNESQEVQKEFWDAVMNQQPFELSHARNDRKFTASLEPMSSPQGFMLLRANLS